MNPILVNVFRGDDLESFHRGVVCLVDEKGKILFSVGDVMQRSYPRSALKFFQQITLLTSGAVKAFNFTSEEIAIMCGSHNGEQEHVDTVLSILRKIECTENDLLCGPQYPTHKPSANTLIKQGLKPSALHNNCSGKHAGFLALCKWQNHSITDYISPKHPIQTQIAELVADFHEYPLSKMKIALDGCSAPIFSMPIYHQAIAYKNLVAAPSAYQAACNALLSAVVEHPFMIAGSGRYCTQLLTITKEKVIGKTGAEGVFSMCFSKQKWGACIKIDDGKMAPQYQVAQYLISQLGIIEQDSLAPLAHYINEPITNFNKFETGQSTVNKDAFKGL